ncbi:hypothetical protein ACFL38_00825, partial [Candidatus Omnitrophota bacterium]
IIAVLFIAVLHQHTLGMRFVQLAREQTIAQSHAKTMIEAIYHAASEGLDISDIFESGTPDGNAPNLYSDIVGGYSLTDEHITVTHFDDPTLELYDLSVTVEWASSTPAGHSKIFLRTNVEK